MYISPALSIGPRSCCLLDMWVNRRFIVASPRLGSDRIGSDRNGTSGAGLWPLLFIGAGAQRVQMDVAMMRDAARREGERRMCRAGACVASPGFGLSIIML